MNPSSTTRTEFAGELQQLHDDVLRLGSMVDRQIARAIEALKKQDVIGAQQVIDLDSSVNTARWKVEDDTMRVIARQGPMAGDLRRILASVHIATNLERMGDHAEGIARLTLRTADQPPLDVLEAIPAMAKVTRSMLNDALQAFVEFDADRAREVALHDDEVDRLYERVYGELISVMIANPDTVPSATYQLWVSHNLERSADRVTNICERIIFAATGDFEEVNLHDFGNRLSDIN